MVGTVQDVTLWHRAEEEARKLNAELEDTDAAFDAQSGFFNRVDVAQLQSNVSYNWYGNPGSTLEQIGPFLNVSGFWDHEDFWAGRGLEEAEIRTGTRLNFRDNVTIWASFSSRVIVQPGACLRSSFRRRRASPPRRPPRPAHRPPDRRARW